MLGVPLAACLLFEAPLLLWVTRRDRARGVWHALALQGVACLACACAQGPWSLLLGISAMTLALSVACALAQARLVEEHPDDPERILVRWTFMGALGDLAAPLLFALCLRLDGGFRSVFAACGAACLAQAAWLWRAGRGQTIAASSTPYDERRPPLMAAMRAALEDPALLGWVFATMLCALLDEILLVFGSLQLHEQRGFDAATTDALLFLLALGSMVGIAITDRLVMRVSAAVVLAASCVACVAVYLAWLALPGVIANGACLFVLGATIGPQFPLAQAQCYRRARGEPVLVNVIESALEPLHAALPFLLGLLADRAGLWITLSVLLLQPLSLLTALIMIGSKRALPPPPRPSAAD